MTGRGTGLATAALDENGEISVDITISPTFVLTSRGRAKKDFVAVPMRQKRIRYRHVPCRLIDFALPITLEDGTCTRQDFGGQVLPANVLNVSDYRVTARELGIDENEYINALYKVNVRTRDEIEVSAALLSNIVNMLCVRVTMSGSQKNSSWSGLTSFHR